MKINFILNNEEQSLELDPLFPTLRFLREMKGLPSVKTGCGEGECGSCTVILGELENGILNYRNVTSCLLPVAELNGKHIVTLEGINGPELSPVQKAFVDEGAVQCGFCTPGFIMSITGFFLSSKELTDENILSAIDGNICRCTGYYSIRRAIEKIINDIAPGIKREERITSLAGLSVIPEYFNTIKGRLGTLKESRKGKKKITVKRESLVIAGGTDLLVNGQGGSGREVQLISEIEGITEISADQDFIHIGAGSTVENIIDSELLNERFPGISDFMYLISSQIIRNTATIGGNIVNASPIGDLSVLFLALDPVLEIRSGSTVREIYLKEFFKGYKVMDLNPGELILKLKVPVARCAGVLNFEKVSRRKYLDIASCNTASYFYIEGDIISRCDLSAGGVAPVPLYLKESSAYLVGKRVCNDTIDKVTGIAMEEISPISDVRGSADYKRELLKRLILVHFNKLEILREVAGG